MSDLLLALTTQIIVASETRSAGTTGNLADRIREVYTALQDVGSGTSEAMVVPHQQPAVPIKRSVFPDYIVCLEDGMKLKLLKRHLQTAFNMTPDQYREKWGLPFSYPMVAPNVAAARSSVAKRNGLGRKDAPEPEVIPRRKPGRPRRS